MAYIDLLLDPFVEGLTENRGSNVGDPLLRRLRQLELWLWEIAEYLLMVLIQKRKDFLHAKAFVPAQITKNKS